MRTLPMARGLFMHLAAASALAAVPTPARAGLVKRLAPASPAVEAPARDGARDAAGGRLGGILRWGSDVEVRAGETVTGPVCAVGGSIKVGGEVEGPVLAVGGGVALLAGAKVDGPVVAVGGKISREPGASVDGAVTELPGPLPMLAALGMAAASLAGLAGALWLVGKLVATAALVALSLVLWAVFQAALERTAEAVEREPGRSALAGVLFWPAAAAAAAAFAVTVIGIPLVPLVGLLASAAGLWGFAALGLTLGRRILGGRWRDTAAPIAAGSLLLALLFAVPGLKWLVVLIAGTMGAGAALLTLFGTRPPGVRAGNGSRS